MMRRSLACGLCLIVASISGCAIGRRGEGSSAEYVLGLSMSGDGSEISSALAAAQNAAEDWLPAPWGKVVSGVLGLGGVVFAVQRHAAASRNAAEAEGERQARKAADASWDEADRLAMARQLSTEGRDRG